MNHIYLCGNLGPRVGMGHYYRLLAFAKLCGDSYQYSMVLPHAHGVDCPLPVLEADGLDDLIQQIQDPAASAVVVDTYEANSQWFDTLRKSGIRSLHIDDLAHDIGADFVLNHAPGIEPGAYEHPNCYIGSEYALLRPEFLRPESTLPRMDGLVCIGGADPDDLSYRLVVQLRAINRPELIHVVLGNMYQGSLLHNRLPGVQLHRNLNATEMANLMDRVAYAIAPASTTALELCSRRTPLLGGYFVDNQKYIHHGLVAEGAMTDLGHLGKVSETHLANALNSNNKEEQRSAQQRVIDHQSQRRVQSVVERMFDHFPIFRLARENDWKILMDWRNDPTTRLNSFDTSEIDETTHRAWYSGSLKNPDRHIYIFELHEQPAGMVRVDFENGLATLSWNVAPSMRGKGMGKRMVAEIYDLLRGRVRAEIKPENIASRKIAEYCGMRQMEISENVIIYGKP
ncbi:MAG: UDP-2,4-diacetamido-2,4,6-trideoxy-beta-L-altropyranose hydrolase [Flavobacteriales bacterium]|nr:UDP-2,4-diacetamido-2,4,6-trideoxy-beta-L-altropyranose hydrolase [Flavobacteriales bacterium]